MDKAIVLLSGGLDSSVALHLALKEAKEVHAISFEYGQRHNRELDSAKLVARKAGIADHRVVTLKLDQWGGSSLTDKKNEY